MTRTRIYNERSISWGESRTTVPPPPLFAPRPCSSPVEKAQEYYFKEKFPGCTYAQNLAKLNIRMDATDGTLDQDGRFNAFKLGHDSKNAQLQCFELFPFAIRTSVQPLAPLHREGYRLMLKALDFVEENPEDHVGPVRLGIDNAAERLSLAERYKLTALLIVCLSDKGRNLSNWETIHLNEAMVDLICPHMD